MNAFKIRRGQVRDLAGQEMAGWFVIDKQAVLQDAETISACIFGTESGQALLKAMVHAGASLENENGPGGT